MQGEIEDLVAVPVDDPQIEAWDDETNLIAYPMCQ
jgi:hypothetical protein